MAEGAPNLKQRTKIEDFISQAISCLTSEYQNWNNPSSKSPTICIPPYFETVRRNLERENLAVDKDGNRGDNSEQKVFDALKKLNNGAILIANIKSIDIENHAGIVWKEYRKMCTDASGMEGRVCFRTNFCHINDAMYLGGKHDFQCDFMLFHWAIGIIIIEAKSTEGSDKKFAKDAVAKFSKTISKIKLLIKVIIGEECCQIPVKALLTSPNLKLTANHSVQTNEEYPIDIIESTSDQKLIQYFAELETKAKRQNFADCKQFENIVAFFSCYRRTIYLNEILNAVEVAKLIDRQNLRPQLKISNKGKENCDISIQDNFSQIENVSNVIFLTGEQKTIVASNEKFQLIFGPPGTGKTLVLIAKLLKAMHEKSANRIVVLSYKQYSSCKEKLKKIISVASMPNRTPAFVGQHKKIESSDDVFCDECGYEDIPFLMKRQCAVGKTLAIFTGMIRAGEYNKCKSVVGSLLTKYNILYLEKIMRGTINIVEYWKKEMDIVTDCTVGHGIKGPTVPPPQLHLTFHETLTAVRDHVRWLMNNGAQPNHIAVINSNRTEIEIIAQFLNSNGINATSSLLQTCDKSAIVVDYYDNAYSMEWPFVIVCSLACTDFLESFLLLASSRAIAHLTVIAFDYHSMQRYVEDYLKIQLMRRLSGWLEFFECTETAVRSYLKERKELFVDEDLIKRRIPILFSVATLRLNIVSTPSKKRPPLFHDCQRLSDCLKIIVQNQIWMHRFAEIYFCVFEVERERLLRNINDFFAETNCDFQLVAVIQQQRFSLNALKTGATSENCVVYGDFQKKFAAEATLNLRRKIVENKNSDAELIKSTEMSETDGSELLVEIAFVMAPLINCYPEIAMQDRL